jgi:hypothetical protein
MKLALYESVITNRSAIPKNSLENFLVFYFEMFSFSHLFFSIALVFCTENISFKQSQKISDQSEVSWFDLYYTIWDLIACSFYLI